MMRNDWQENGHEREKEGFGVCVRQLCTQQNQEWCGFQKIWPPSSFTLHRMRCSHPTLSFHPSSFYFPSHFFIPYHFCLHCLLPSSFLGFVWLVSSAFVFSSSRSFYIYIYISWKKQEHVWVLVVMDLIYTCGRQRSSWHWMVPWVLTWPWLMSSQSGFLSLHTTTIVIGLNYISLNF